MQQKKGTDLLSQIIQDLISVKCTKRISVSAKTHNNILSILPKLSSKNLINHLLTQVTILNIKTPKEKNNLSLIRLLIKPS